MNKFGGFVKLESFNNTLSKLIPMLVEKVGALRSAGDYSTDAIEKSGVNSIIFEYTGMKVNMFVKDIGINAQFRIPAIDANHPFFKQVNFQHYFGSEISSNALNNSIPIKGWVDEKNFRVGGGFSKLDVNVVVGHQLLTSNKFSVEGVVAIIAHELGHAYDYFRLVGSLVYDSWVTSSAARAAVGAATPEVKNKVFIRAKDALGIEELNHDELLREGDFTRKELVESVLITNTMLQGTTLSKTPKYDARTIEQNADAFVVAHGGGRELARALATLYSINKDRSTHSSVRYVITEVLKTLWFLIIVTGMPIYAVLILISSVPSIKMYDSPYDRLTMIKQELVAAMRDMKEPDEKKAIADDIEAVEMTLKELNKRRTVYEVMYEAITPAGRRKFKEEAFNEQLRSLIFNELQAKAVTLRNL